MTSILGISALYHDSAAALLVDGEIVAAAQEERFTRNKHDHAYPERAIDYVLAEAGLGINQLDYVVFYDKPFLKFERLLESYIASAPRGIRSFKMAMPIWLREKLFLKSTLHNQLKLYEKSFSADRILFAEHHVSHAASAFYPSPFAEALVLTLDGVGEWATASVAIGKGRELKIVKEQHFPHSLGLLYTAFTYLLGFRVNSGEYKLMGLAPYGKPRFKDIIVDKLMDLKDDGSFRLDLSYFNYVSGLTMTSRKLSDLFGIEARDPEKESLTSLHMDIAASIQSVTEEIILRMARSLADEYGLGNLCLAGGVALNCVANGKLLREGCFERVWVQPAAGDAGGAVGAALAAWHGELQQPRKVNLNDSMKGSYLGPSYDNDEIAARLDRIGARYIRLSEDDLIGRVAQLLADGAAAGWFQGRMEFGPRALGGRSILADARDETMQKKLNLKVKFRESFRPFAPSVLREEVANWFDLDGDSPYMLMVADVAAGKRCEISPEQQNLIGIEKLNAKRSVIPAVTHVDNSARVQTVHKSTNPRYHALITKFKELTGCPVLVNTSFNVRGEPIVCTPEDAYTCFMGTDLDLLAIGDFLLLKDEQDRSLALDYRSRFSPD